MRFKNIYKLQHIAIATLSIAALIVPYRAYSTMPVIDLSRAMDFLIEIEQMREQVALAYDQLERAKATYESMTGNRGFGDLFRNDELRAYLPEDMKVIYDLAKKGHSLATTPIFHSLEHSEKLHVSAHEAQIQIEDRDNRTPLSDKAVALNAYEGAKKRLENIDNIINEIGNTSDQKSIGELQARIMGEQAELQNELTKLQLIAQLSLAEQKLIKRQKRKLNRQILDSKNKQMPKL